MELIDLHTHSSRSDGTDTPTELIRLAAQNGAAYIALTDHDTLSGLDEAADEALRCGIGFIRGVELSTTYEDQTTHLLGLQIGESERLDAVLKCNQSSRRRRAERLAQRLVMLGYPDYLAAAEGRWPGLGLGRPHFATLLIEDGYFETIDDTFDKLLAAGREGYVAQEHTPTVDAIDAVHSAGGVAILAHPFRRLETLDQVSAALSYLAGHGLDGVEVLYSEYTPQQRRDLAGLAGRFGLVLSGGSDYHGMNKPHLSPVTGTGDLFVPATLLRPIERMASGRRAAR